MQITEHFSSDELNVDWQESRLLMNAHYLCVNILEPIRSQFGPMRIHDGYRNPEHNAAVGGKPTSWHQFDGTQSAADFDCTNAGFQQVFDWVRLESGLLFDKVILEHNAAGQPRCIHVQVDSSAIPRRQAYIGNTGAGTVYTPVEVK
jgi:putative chitinase